VIAPGRFQARFPQRSAPCGCVGKTGDISKAQHCRAEVYLEGEGWFPIDPADVSKVVLKAKLPVTDPEVATLREQPTASPICSF
jgi:transglutaminase-like putative cysteine protease